MKLGRNHFFFRILFPLTYWFSVVFDPFFTSLLINSLIIYNHSDFVMGK